MEYITAMLVPSLVMAGIGLIFGIVLMVLSHKFKKDEGLADQVEKLLSNSNCGGCGRAGCADFAAGLVKGEVDINDCNSTSTENKKEILKLLNLDCGVEKTKVVVKCSGGSNCKVKYSYLGYGDCNMANVLSGGDKACKSGCIGLSSCIDACPSSAISMGENGSPVINRSLCTSCGKCVLVCPKRVFTRVPEAAKIYIACGSNLKGKDARSVCTAGCIACGLCEKNCEQNAITISDNLPRIDYQKCTGCLKCAEKCPTKVIKVI